MGVFKQDGMTPIESVESTNMYEVLGFLVVEQSKQTK